MTEIGRLLLPAPGAGGFQPPLPTGVAPTRLPARRVGGTGDEDGPGGEGPESARAKNFRFRVLDGGRQENALSRGAQSGGFAGAATGASAGSAGDAASRAGRPNQEIAGDTPPSAARGPGSAFAPFLAQLIGQEQGRTGLHDPPLRAADRAYRLAGAAPPLEGATAGSAISIAV
jgi:hypothetical protein